MRKLLIIDPKQDRDMQINKARELGIVEISDNIPARYRDQITTLPCVIVESATQPEKVLSVFDIDNINTFSPNFNSIPELPKLSDPISIKDQIETINNRLDILEGLR